MGRLDRIRQVQQKSQGSISLDLNEGNVEKIFKSCIAKKETPDDKCIKSVLFSRLAGYSPDAERMVSFDKEQMLTNKKCIQYLYGQLKNIHSQNGILQINDAFKSYQGTNWTTNKGILLEFLYLGARTRFNIYF